MAKEDTVLQEKESEILDTLDNIYLDWYSCERLKEECWKRAKRYSSEGDIWKAEYFHQLRQVLEYGKKGRYID